MVLVIIHQKFALNWKNYIIKFSKYKENFLFAPEVKSLLLLQKDKKINKDENEHILTVFPKKEDDYTAVSSDNPTPFNLYSWRIDNIIKKFDKMMGEEDKEKTESD